MDKNLLKIYYVKTGTDPKHLSFFKDVVNNRAKDLNIEDLDIRTNIKKFNPHAWDGTQFKKGTTFATKGALAHNMLVDSFKLNKKYKKIESGDKIHTSYVKPNKWGYECIAYLGEFPTEFGLEPDKMKMVEKSITALISPVYECMGWDIPDSNKLYSFDLNDLLS